jgi:hypothetical protein
MARSRAGQQWILASQRKRSRDWGDPLSDILRMSLCDVREMFLEGDDQAEGQHSDPIVQACAIPHDDLLLGAIKIVDTEPQTCYQAYARAVEHLGPQRMGSRESPDGPQRFCYGSHRGQVFGLAGMDGVNGGLSSWCLSMPMSPVSVTAAI